MTEMDKEYQGIQGAIMQSIRGARQRERAAILNWIEEYMKCNPVKYVDGGEVTHYRACDCTRCHPNDQGELLNLLKAFINRREEEHDENGSI